MSYPFLKGHGTENDFVILPDPDGTSTRPARGARRARCATGARASAATGCCSRRSAPPRRGEAAEAEWFMDYRNADGSVAEMCGNGVRVFARYLQSATGEAEPDRASAPAPG